MQLEWELPTRATEAVRDLLIAYVSRLSPNLTSLSAHSLSFTRVERMINSPIYQAINIFGLAKSVFRFLCSILRKSPKFWQPNISSPVVLMYAVLCVCRAHLSSSVFAWLFPPLAPKPSGFSSHFRASIILLHLLFTYLPSPIEVAPWVESLGLILFLVLSQDLTSRTVSQAWHLLFWTK